MAAGPEQCIVLKTIPRDGRDMIVNNLCLLILTVPGNNGVYGALLEGTDAGSP